MQLYKKLQIFTKMGFETFDPDIFLDKNKCPFSKKFVDFIPNFLKSQNHRSLPTTLYFLCKIKKTKLGNHTMETPPKHCWILPPDKKQRFPAQFNNKIGGIYK